ncbi:hypothetical protein [Peribacillus cavernae]|uniref:hypothetical protein n=1 Tax=Peribacillus cavernae TaxID=1674310 RepID=UPI00163C1B0A|nr:hypothetical protein [Peribacillus cavernae]MDQ0218871.1 hypothetical protein [Peribacillus cavernae]
MPTSPQEVAILVGLEVISQPSDGEKTAPHTDVRIILVGLAQDVLTSTFATGRGGS